MECSECEVAPTPSPSSVVVTSAPVPAGNCFSWCAANSQPWDTKCGWLGCMECSECEFTPTPSPSSVVATPVPVSIDNCFSWCTGNSQPWDTKCGWLGCMGCTECQISTQPTPTTILSSAPSTSGAPTSDTTSPPSVSVVPSAAPVFDSAAPSISALPTLAPVIPTCSTLETSLDGIPDLDVKALAFDLVATSNIDINEFMLHLNDEADLVIEIWTKADTWSLDQQYPYDGTAWDRAGWTQLHSVAGVTGNGPGVLTSLGPFGNSVAISAGTVQSFYVWSSSTTGLLRDFTTDQVQVSNDDLYIERGAGFFTKPESDPSSGSLSIWGSGFEFQGTIEYCSFGSSTPAPFSDNDTPSPSISLLPSAVPTPTVLTTPNPTSLDDCASLETSLDGTSSLDVKAIAFDMVAASNIRITEFLLNLNDESDLAIEIWTKQSSWSLDQQYPYGDASWDVSDWVLVKSATGVAGSGSMTLTSVGAFDTPVTINAGSVQSFYVWLTSTTALPDSIRPLR